MDKETEAERARLSGVVAVLCTIFQGPTPHSLPRAELGGLNTGMGRQRVTGV